MLTKEDYMKLSKEKLAELLMERDRQLPIIVQSFSSKIIPCYTPDGICTNPQRDCINCPKTYEQSNTINTITTTATTET